MSTARELAIEILPHFQKAVLSGHVYTYGHYAETIGRSTARDGIAVGQAMHAIGAACAMCAIPIAPLHYVARADGEWRGIFEKDLLESIYVLPHYDLLYVTAREFNYSQSHFRKLDRALRIVLPKHLGPDKLSPHDLWHVAINSKLRDGRSILDVSIQAYQELYEQLKQAGRK